MRDRLQHAFKEWAVICKALAQGKQALLLRKGGIAEEGGQFTLAQTRFWLYPTYVHQQQRGVRAEALPFLEQAEAERPPPGIVRLSHFAEVQGVYHVRALTPALLLGHLHYWSAEVVEKRFHYQGPGLYVLPVRVWKAAEEFELTERPQYRGCKSWVELEQALPTEGATPVLGEQALEDLREALDLLLNPTALV
jgi:hypothetical protein